MSFAISFAVRHSRCLGMHIKLAHSYINILIMSMREMEMEMENVGHFGSKEIKTEGFISMIFVQEEFSIVKRHVWSEFQMRCVFMCLCVLAWDLFYFSIFPHSFWWLILGIYICRECILLKTNMLISWSSLCLNEEKPILVDNQITCH